MLAQVGGTEALRELSEQDEGVQERVRARFGKAPDLDQSVGRKADLAQLWKVVQAPADPEVVGVVDGGFRCARPDFPYDTV
jgi:hypothetical protein